MKPQTPPGRRCSADLQSAVSPNCIRLRVEGSDVFEPATSSGLKIRETADYKSALHSRQLLHHIQQRRRPAFHAELLKNMFDVFAHGARADFQDDANLRIAFAFRQP